LCRHRKRHRRHNHGCGRGGALYTWPSEELFLPPACNGLGFFMGLGLALSKPDKRVIVLDGDGSLLMNLGALTTLAWYAPKNLIHVVFDNQSLLSVGGFPTATSAGSDLAGIAQKSGYFETTTVHSVEDFTRAWRAARERLELSMIVAKVEAAGPKSFLMDLPLLENRFQFQRWLKEG